MQRCIMTAVYTHLCDVYTKNMEYDDQSGSMEWSWTKLEEDVPCLGRPFVNGGIKGNGTMERFDTDDYLSTDFIRLKTKGPLSKSYRVTNIRSIETKDPVWVEEELDWGPTIFNVDGCAPIPNAFTGAPDEFVSILSRAQSQRME